MISTFKLGFFIAEKFTFISSTFFFLFFTFNVYSLTGQSLKSLSEPKAIALYNLLAGDYSDCQVKLGDDIFTGRIILGNLSKSKFGNENDFTFSISYPEKRDIQFGKVKDFKVLISNFGEFIIKAEWENNFKNQPIKSGQIQIAYSLEKTSYESAFTTLENYGLSLVWQIELSKSNKDKLNAILRALYKDVFDELLVQGERRKKVIDSLFLVNQKKQQLQDSLFQVEQEKNRVQDSIFHINEKRRVERRREQDSLYVVQKRITDSISLLKIQEQKRLADLEQKRLDSIYIVRKKNQEIEQFKSQRKRNIKLNYWGFFMGANQIQKEGQLLTGSAWRYISRDSIAVNGKPVDGSGFGYGLFFSRRIASILGFEIGFSEIKDGSYKVDSEPNYLGQTTQVRYALLKSTFFALGPVLTIPISKCNLDVKYSYTYSRSLFKEPRGSEVLKHTTNGNGRIFGAGFRFPVGQGEYNSNNKFTLGQIGLYYELYDFNFNFKFGNLPFSNTALSIRYVQTIN